MSLTLACMSQWGDIITAQHILLGYILSDTALKLCAKDMKWDVLLHHALTLELIYSTQNRPESYHMIRNLMVMEFTTPLLYLSIILRKLKLFKYLMFASFGAALFLWIPLRLVAPFAIAVESFSYDSVASCATFVLWGIQVYWFGIMCTQFSKVLFKEKKPDFRVDDMVAP